MQRIAVPMIGGMVSSTVLTLIVITAVYGLVRGWGCNPARSGGPRRKRSDGLRSEACVNTHHIRRAR